MKYFKILTVLLFSLVISFSACNSKTKTPVQETVKPMEAIESPSTPTATTPNMATSEASQNTGGVWHYTCSKGCTGGAGTAGNCDKCGGALVHNSAFHANPNSTPNTSPFAAPYANPAPAPAAAAEPSKNSAGVWHYTCGKGCVGGSGTVGTCSTCGGALAHNAAYHQ